MCRDQPKIACILVEIGYMTNEAQELLFNDDAYLEKIGDAIAEGILKTIQSLKDAAAKDWHPPMAPYKFDRYHSFPQH